MWINVSYYFVILNLFVSKMTLEVRSTKKFKQAHRINDLNL